MRKVDFLRGKYPHFFYRGYSYELKKGDLHISFDFSVPPDIKFRSKVVVSNVSQKDVKRVGESTLNNLVFHLGLAESLSYWKATASPEIIVSCGPLSKSQIAWWEDLFMKGMGEYFFTNNINFTEKDFLEIISSNESSSRQKASGTKLKSRTVVPLGGGKDSIVTLELLKQAKEDIIPFILNPKREQKDVLHIANQKRAIIVERTIDPKLLLLNKNEYLNGHTPFSAYLAFLTTLCAALFDYKYIAVSNEHSSNEGNTKYLGLDINHQYSKTYEFEKKFRQYSKSYLLRNSEYFSFMRPLYEIQIAKLFSKYPKYFPAFLSCNEAHKTYSGSKKPAGTWCGTCSKCLFVFISLYPFVEEKQLVKVFKKNLFKDKNLIPLMKELMGMKKIKPFECVGTKRESVIALYLSMKKQHDLQQAIPKYFKEHILPDCRHLEKESESILSSWDRKHFLPTKFIQALKEVM